MIGRWLRRSREMAARNAEPFLVAPLGGLVLLAHLSFSRFNPWIFALDVASVVLAGLCVLWPVGATAALALAMLGYFAFSPTTQSVGQLAILVPVFSHAYHGRTRLAWVSALGLGSLVVLDTARATRRLDDFWGELIFWSLLLAGAWAVGSHFRALMSRAAAAHELKVEREHAALARDLHDTLADSLARMSLRAESAKLRGAATAEDLDYFVRTSSQCVQEMRTVVALLRPTGQEGGRELTVRSLQDKVGAVVERLESEGFRVRYESRGSALQTSPQQGRALDMVLRESANNVIRHGDRSAPVVIMQEGDEDGFGLVITNLVADEHSVPSESVRFGLRGMTERAASLGFEVSSGPLGKTWVTRISVPSTPPPQGREG